LIGEVTCELFRRRETKKRRLSIEDKGAGDAAQRSFVASFAEAFFGVMERNKALYTPSFGIEGKRKFPAQGAEQRAFARIATMGAKRRVDEIEKAIS
jgi:hypothetical protein